MSQPKTTVQNATKPQKELQEQEDKNSSTTNQFFVLCFHLGGSQIVVALVSFEMHSLLQ